MVATSVSVLLVVAAFAVFVLVGVRADREGPRANLDDFTVLLPALLGLWHRTTTTVWMGIVAGAFGAGLVLTGSLDGAVASVTFPGAVSTLAPFAGALLASGVVTWVASLLGRPTVELDDLDARVRERATAAAASPGGSRS